MLDVYGRRRSERCDGVGRRDFLRVGSLAFGGLTLSNLLRAQALASGGRQPPENVPRPKAKSGILLWLPGGPSHFETVWSGSLEVAELKADQLRSCGPDPNMKAQGALTLTVTIEPLPG